MCQENVAVECTSVKDVLFERLFLDFVKNVQFTFDEAHHNRQDDIIPDQYKFAGRPLFFVKTERPLLQIYHELISDSMKHMLNCSICDKFIRQYGSLAYVNKDGELVSALWNPNKHNEPFKTIVTALADVVSKGSIDMLFMPTDRNVMIGTKHQGVAGRHHLRLIIDTATKYPMNIATKSKSQFRKFCAYYYKLLRNWPKSVIAPMRELVSSDKLPTKITSMLKFELWAFDMLASEPCRKKRENKLAVFCAIQSTDNHVNVSHHVTEFMSDLSTQPVEIAVTQLLAKYETDKYLTTYDDPKPELNIDTVCDAEELVNRLKLNKSFCRRYATLQDIERDCELLYCDHSNWHDFLGSVFGVIKHNISIDATNDLAHSDFEEMSMEDFIKNILPDAARIEWSMDGEDVIIGTMSTASDDNATPILIYDTPEHRNRIAVIFANEENPSEVFDIESKQWMDIIGIMDSPHNQPNVPIEAKAALSKVQPPYLFLLKEREISIRHTVGLMPVVLRRDLFPIRHVIDEYNANVGLEDSSPNDNKIVLTVPVINGVLAGKLRVTIGAHYHYFQICNTKKK